MEVKGQELDLQEKRMILDAIQGGVDSMLKIGRASCRERVSSPV